MKRSRTAIVQFLRQMHVNQYTRRASGAVETWICPPSCYHEKGPKTNVRTTRSNFRNPVASFLRRSDGVGRCYADRKFARVRSSVCLSRNANERLDLEALIFAHVCTWIRYVGTPIFIQIVNVLDLHFKG